MDQKNNPVIKYLFLLLLCISAPSTIFADENIAKKQANNIAAQVLSPFCPGRSLLDCPSQESSELKNEILLRVSRGESKEEVLTFLYEKFGDEIRAVPPLKGFNSTAWLLPIGFVLIGILIIFYFIAKQKKKVPNVNQEALDKGVESSMQDRIDSLIHDE